MNAVHETDIALPRDVLEAELLLASRMRALPTIQRTYAHDVRTPLNGIQLSVELLAGVLAEFSAASSPTDLPEAAWQRHIGVARDEIARLTRLVQALVDLPHGLPEAREHFDLRDVAVELVPLLRAHDSRRRVKVTTELGGEAAGIHGARERLRQALLNAALNVLERTPSPTRLRLRVGTLPGGRVLAALEHDGPPLPPDALDWTLVRDSAAASRLAGLWAARLVVESHGGVVAIAPGSGEESLRFELPGRSAA